MARRSSTYGENMSRWENEKDERDWRNSLNRAIENENYALVTELIEEGQFYEYIFPTITDNKALEIMKKYNISS